MNKKALCLIALLNIFPVLSYAEEKSVQDQLNETKSQLEREQTSNNELKEQLTAKEGEVTSLKEKIKELEEKVANMKKESGEK